MARQQMVDPKYAGEHYDERRERSDEEIGPALRSQLVANCDCWVAGRPDEERFQIRYGAHCPDCPAYRESGDPVDRQHDEALRDAHCSRPEHQRPARPPWVRAEGGCTPDGTPKSEQPGVCERCNEPTLRTRTQRQPVLLCVPCWRETTGQTARPGELA